jgi:hypothetical protein
VIFSVIIHWKIQNLKLGKNEYQPQIKRKKTWNLYTGSKVSKETKENEKVVVLSEEFY